MVFRINEFENSSWQSLVSQSLLSLCKNFWTQTLSNASFPFFPFLSPVALNRPDAKDTDIENLQDAVVDSLFSFLVTLGNTCR